ncbi:unnamed protein product [Lymnaea stagnalis]|uniref:Uncharacterized protein n=1 Tax=Lymnaea stagnalis TaxID=6523 RepID=A0AAV2IMK4_LYMST
MLNNRSETPLYKAAANGRGKNVKLLLKYGASANIQSENGNTALMRALKHGFQNVAKVLLAAEADVNIRNKRGENALLMAAKSGCTETVKLLMEAGADPLSLTKFGNTGLSLAGNKDIAELFVQAGADVNLRNMHGQTPMPCAVKRRKYDVLNLLLKHGANVNMKDLYGDTPLIAALKVSEVRLILRLLAAKANVNLQNKKGKTALMYATSISILIRFETKIQRIVQLRILDLLLQHGADANLKDNIGRTALMYTYSRTNQKDYGHKLVKHGADLEAEDYQGRTTLTQVLLAWGMSSKVIELLKLGAKPVLKSKYRDILLQRCPTVFVGKEINELLRLLICIGIVSTKSFKSYFPILLDTNVELCLCHGNYDLLRYILANCYVSNKDLTYIRLRHNQSYMCTLPARFGPDHSKMDALIQRAACQPWPLVNLAFIAASTMMGESPERVDRIGNSQLPNPLKDMLMFRTEIARTAVG